MAAQPDPNRPGGLLAALVPSGVLRQPEVAVTTGIWWLLGLEGASSALDHLVARNGLSPQQGEWRTEVRGGEGGRTDLEYMWGSPLRTMVIVEAKLGHTLTADQVSAYATRFGDEGGLLVVLAPVTRTAEARAVIEQSRALVDHVGVVFDLWTYDEVIHALEQALPGSGDVAQLHGLIHAHSALDVAPVASEDLLESRPSRREDVWRVLDLATFGIGGTRWPMGSDTTLEQRRYVPVGPYAVGLAVGVGRKGLAPDETDRPWAWLRVGGTDSFGRLAARALRERSGLDVTEDEAGAWVPVPVPPGVFGSEAVDVVRDWVEGISELLATEIAKAVADQVDGIPAADQQAASAVLGIAPLSLDDLLITSTRRDDVWALLRESARGFYDRRMWPQLSNDADFELVRYLPIPPYGANIATCLAPRVAGAGTATPLAWLRVHRDTPHAAAVKAAFESFAPGDVVADAHGWAIPADIPPGLEAPSVVVAVRAQFRGLIAAIHAELSRDR